jgi:UrcA family protein
MKTLKTALCGLTLGLAAIPLAPALAQQGEIVVSPRVAELPGGVLVDSLTISYADLDLGYATDRAELNRRITTTARAVCDNLRFHADNPVLDNRCESRAIRGAYRQVDAARLGG